MLEQLKILREMIEDTKKLQAEILEMSDHVRKMSEGMREILGKED